MTRNQEILSRADALARRAHSLAGYTQMRRQALSRAESELETIKADQVLLEKARAVLAHLLDTTAGADLRGMDNLVTYGLKTVYPEKNLEFKSEIVDTGKKVSVEMSTLRNGKAASKDQSGSITVLESLLIRILAILKMDKARLLIADEPFAAIGQDHINNIGTLLEELSKRLGLDILLFTHNPGVSDACMFRATLGSDEQLKLTKVGGSEDSGFVHQEQRLPGDESATAGKPTSKKRSPAKRKVKGPVIVDDTAEVLTDA